PAMKKQKKKSPEWAKSDRRSAREMRQMRSGGDMMNFSREKVAPRKGSLIMRMYCTKSSILTATMMAASLGVSAFLLSGCGRAETASSANGAGAGNGEVAPVVFTEREVEAACGLCQFEMDSPTCELAI